MASASSPQAAPRVRISHPPGCDNAYDGQQAAWLSRADAGKTWAAKAQGVGSWIELDFPSSFAAVGSTSQSCGTHGNIFSDGPFNGSKTPYQCTTGGTAAEGSACVFPFTYSFTTYNDCTSSGNSNVPWCYTVSGASIGSPWGNCQDCNSNTLEECEARCALDSRPGAIPFSVICSRTVSTIPSIVAAPL